MKRLFTLLALFIYCSIGFSQTPPIIVSSPGAAPCDFLSGTYISPGFTNLFNGKLQWSYSSPITGTVFLIRFTLDNKWSLYEDAGGTAPVYFYNNSTDPMPPCKGWVALNPSTSCTSSNSNIVLTGGGCTDNVITFTGAISTLWNLPTNWDLNRLPTVLDEVIINDKIVKADNGNNIITVKKMTVSGSMADLQDGNATKIEVTNSLTWSDGKISEALKTSLNSTTTFSGASTKIFGKTSDPAINWENLGTITWPSGYITLNSHLNNYGTIDMNGSFYYGTSAGATGSINNYGLFKSRNAPSNSHIVKKCWNTTSGIVREETFNLIFEYLDNEGEINAMGLNSYIGVFAGPIKSTTNLTGLGFFQPSDVDIQGALAMNTVRLELNTLPTFGSIHGAGSISTNGIVNFRCGKLSIPLNLSPLATMNILANPNDKVINTTITNNGTTNWMGGAIKFLNGTFKNNNKFNINLVPAAASMTETSGTNAFEMCGEINTAPLSQTATIAVPLIGCTTVSTPILSLTGNLTLPSFTNRGLIKTNTTPLTTNNLTITTPTLTLDPTNSIVEAKIIGNQNDRFDISGAVVYGGTLRLRFKSNPPIGTYTVLSAASGSGTFTKIEYAIGEGAYFNTPIAGVTVNTTLGLLPISQVDVVVLSSPLPVELLSFKAKNTEGGNLLTWQTASEINTSHFDIERSNDGIKFNKIGELKAQNKAANYQFIDNKTSARLQTSPTLSDPLIDYYRLTINDLDGKTNVSKIVSIENKNDKSIKINRNTEGSILIETNNLIELITITNPIGQLVKSTKEKQFLINDLNAGIYIISVKTDKGFLSQKIFKN